MTASPVADGHTVQEGAGELLTSVEPHPFEDTEVLGRNPPAVWEGVFGRKGCVLVELDEETELAMHKLAAKKASHVVELDDSPGCPEMSMQDHLWPRIQ